MMNKAYFGHSVRKGLDVDDIGLHGEEEQVSNTNETKALDLVRSKLLFFQ